MVVVSIRWHCIALAIIGYVTVSANAQIKTGHKYRRKNDREKTQSSLRRKQAVKVELFYFPAQTVGSNKFFIVTPTHRTYFLLNETVTLPLKYRSRLLSLRFKLIYDDEIAANCTCYTEISVECLIADMKGSVPIKNDRPAPVKLITITFHLVDHKPVSSQLTYSLTSSLLVGF